jgi:hypothetical protein
MMLSCGVVSLTHAVANQTAGTRARLVSTVPIGSPTITSLRWFKIGGRERLLVLQSDRLSIFPGGASVMLPPNVAPPSESVPSPQELVLRISPGQTQAAVINRPEAVAVLLSLPHLTLGPVLANTQDVGWYHGKPCRVAFFDEPVTKDNAPAAKWQIGNEIYIGPRGFVATAMSEDSAMLLAREVAFGSGRPTIRNEAILTLSSDRKHVTRITRFFTSEAGRKWNLTTALATALLRSSSTGTVSAQVGADTTGGTVASTIFIFKARSTDDGGSGRLSHVASIDNVVAPALLNAGWLTYSRTVRSAPGQTVRLDTPGSYISEHWQEEWLHTATITRSRLRSIPLVRTMTCPILGDYDVTHRKLAYATRAPWSGTTPRDSKREIWEGKVWQLQNATELHAASANERRHAP